MRAILKFFFPFSASGVIRWQRHAQEVEQGIWLTTPDELLIQWCQTDIIQLYIPGEWLSVWQVEIPDVPHNQVQNIIPALLEENLSEDIDELHFAILRTVKQQAIVAVIHQQHMKYIVDWLQCYDINHATAVPDWMSIPCGNMIFHADRVIARIDICQGWSGAPDLIADILRAQISAQNHPLQLTVIGKSAQEVAARIGTDSEKLKITSELSLCEHGQPEGNLLTGPWQPRVSYQKQWIRWRAVVLPVFLILVSLLADRVVTLWSINEQVIQSRIRVEKQFLSVFPEQKRIVNLRSQIITAINNSRSRATDKTFLEHLSVIANALKSASLSKLEIRSFTYDQKHQTLHFRLSAPDFSSFDKLRDALAVDFFVQQDALINEDNYVSGAVTLRRK
ncbi:type II secretion system protein GspL [Escherichia coli]|uniref:type II secretion system protein GspL n=1 Tax=Escherichia coli TaxID=562 RepID=UPI0015D79041|nr:type II secretion system protein GspL [Escherichia coli]